MKLCSNCERRPTVNQTNPECRACYQYRFRHGQARPAELYEKTREHIDWQLAEQREQQQAIRQRKHHEATDMAAAKKRDPHLAAFLNRIHNTQKAAA